MAEPKRPKVFLLTPTIAPYRIPVFNFLAAQPDLCFHVCFLSRSEWIRKWQIDSQQMNFEYSVLPGIHFFVPWLDWGIHLSAGLLWTMIRYRPQIVVCTAWDNPAYFLMLIYARLMGCKVVLWAGTSNYRQVSRKRWVFAVKSWFIRRFDSYLSYGTEAKKYLVEHGAPPERIVVGGNSVDVHMYERLAEQSRARGRVDKLREQYSGKVILYVGRFIENKRPDYLLEALARMKQGDWTCILIGWGPDEPEIRTRCNQPDLRGKVEIAGFQPAERLVDFYLLARVFVLPSFREPWGLVVNEAMACGLPILVSKNCGCRPELCKEGVNGYSFSPKDTKAISQLMQKVSSSDIEALGNASRHIASSFTPEIWAVKLKKIIDGLA